MQRNIKTGIIFGTIGGLLTFLFGGWSVAVIGSLMGIGLGLGFGGRIQKDTPLKMAQAALKPAFAASGTLLILSLIQNFVIQNLIGKYTAELGTFIFANLFGFLGSAA